MYKVEIVKDRIVVIEKSARYWKLFKAENLSKMQTSQC